MEMYRVLPTTTEGAPSHVNRARLLTGNWWWLLPPAAALFYPQAVTALYESGKLLHGANWLADAGARLAILVSVGLVYGVPAVGIGVAYLLGRHERTARYSDSSKRSPCARWHSGSSHGR
jgi:hypothetical protein